jgi:hypothetical protein
MKWKRFDEIKIIVKANLAAIDRINLKLIATLKVLPILISRPHSTIDSSQGARFSAVSQLSALCV